MDIYRRRKYNNKRSTVDGYKFDSIKEAKYYTYLKFREKAGEIEDLKIHPKFTFPLKYKSGRNVTYTADFSYNERIKMSDNSIRMKAHILDVKGMITDVFKIKWTLMQHFFGVEVTIV